mmetsp:Transcript_15021/g.26476  ORF Transcript_15021/g.26476 Transcript_15021/m.26476 type:complete len:289 (-) Transcript_15021:242-1108(-)
METSKVEDARCERVPLLCGAAFQAVYAGFHLSRYFFKMLIILAHGSEQSTQRLALLKSTGGAEFQVLKLFEMLFQVVVHELGALVRQLQLSLDVSVGLNANINFAKDIPLLFCNLLFHRRYLFHHLPMRIIKCTFDNIYTLRRTLHFFSKHRSLFSHIAQLLYIDAGNLFLNGSVLLLKLRAVSAQVRDDGFEVIRNPIVGLRDLVIELLPCSLDFAVCGIVRALEVILQLFQHTSLLMQLGLQPLDPGEVKVFTNLDHGGALCTGHFNSSVQVLSHFELAILVVEFE